MDRFHGIFSGILGGIAFLTGLLAIIKTNMQAGLLYFILIFAMLAVIIYSYCCKCPCRESSCGHVMPGKMTKYFPQRKQGNYSLIDILSVAVALFILIAFPQFWLINNSNLFITFWVLLIIAGIEIRLYVCTSCENEKCALCKNKGGDC